MEFGAPFWVRALQIAGFVMAVAIAVLGNDVMFGFGPFGSKAAGMSRCEKADSEREDLAEESLAGSRGNDCWAEEMDNLVPEASGDEAVEQFFAELFTEPSAPSPETRTQTCADLCDRLLDPTAGCTCPDGSVESAGPSVVTATLGDGSGVSPWASRRQNRPMK
jgi:hypothetical protein